MNPDAAALIAALDATWPPAARRRIGPWIIREGQGGGSRVSAATAAGDWADGDIPAAEAAMRALGQVPLFKVTPGDPLDAALAARGYRWLDETRILAAPVATLAIEPPHLTALAHWPPLAVTVDLWAAGGIGPARLAVMQRAAEPKTAILARTADRPAGAAFAAIAGAIACLHAVTVAPAFRRQGSAHNMLRRAAVWAQTHGAIQLALAVTADNAPAGELYASAGMQTVGHYLYRII
ncbi:MAG: GNAT family N-acetyltransferase [Gemmobacter sp.]